MKIFYDELSGSHNVTDEWIVTSASMVLYSDSGKRIHEEHVKNPFVWGGPSLVYTLVAGEQGTETYTDWQKPLVESAINILIQAVNYENENPQDSELTIISWNGFDYIPDSLSDLPQVKVAQLIDRPYSKLIEVSAEKGINLNWLNTDNRIEALIQLYYGSQNKIS